MLFFGLMKRRRYTAVIHLQLIQVFNFIHPTSMLQLQQDNTALHKNETKNSAYQEISKSQTQKAFQKAQILV